MQTENGVFRPRNCWQVLFCEKMAQKITEENVRREVHRFWAILSGEQTDKLEEMYSPAATVFMGKAKRSESAMLMAMRTSRQRPERASASRAQVGSIDVQIVKPDLAIAAYTFSFHVRKNRADGTQVQLNTSFGRGTQIFQRGEDGALRIVHQHLSATAPPDMEKCAG